MDRLLSLFPLHTVLFPGGTLPLHIFEERYKLMIGRCIETESEFGVVWLADDGLRDVGCAARVAQVLERMDDGRMNVLVQGTRPFEVLRRVDDLPYPAGDLQFLDDDPAEPPEEVLAAARERYAELVEHVTAERPSDDQLAQLDAYGMAATIELSAKPKQALLEERSEERRLRSVGELFGLALQRLVKAQAAEEAARSNGHVRL